MDFTASRHSCCCSHAVLIVLYHIVLSIYCCFKRYKIKSSVHQKGLSIYCHFKGLFYCSLPDIPSVFWLLKLCNKLPDELTIITTPVDWRVILLGFRHCRE